MPKAQKLFEVRGFVGQDATTSPYSLGPEFALDAINFDASRYYRAFSLTKGRTSGLITPSLSAETTSIGFFFQTSAIGQLPNTWIVAYALGGTFQEVEITATPSAPIALSLPIINTNAPIPSNGDITGRSAQFLQFQGFLYITTDGEGESPYGMGTYAPQSPIYPAPYIGDIPLKLQQNSTQLAQWGIAPPFVAPGATVASGSGNLNGYYYWRVTYYSSTLNQESSPSPISPTVGVFPTPLLLTNQNATISLTGIYKTNPPPAWFDPQVDTINIYRTGGTSQTWTQVGSVAATAATFTDTLSDTNLTGATLVLHQDPPPNFNATIVHKGRLWGLGYTYSYPWNFTDDIEVTNAFSFTLGQLSDLWFSLYNQPGAFDCVNQVLPLDREASGDSGVALLSISSVLLCLKQKTTWAVYGDSAEDFYAIKAFDIGCIDANTADAWGGTGFWLATTGVYKSNGQSYENISNGAGGSGGIQQQLGKLLSNPVTSFVGFCVNQFYYLFETTTNTGWAYYIPTGTWAQVQFSYSPKVLVNDSQGGLMYAVDGTGKGLDSWFAQEGDSYGNLVGTWTSGNSDCGAPEAYKEFMYAIVQIPATDPTANFTIYFYVDGVLVCTASLTPRSPGVLATASYSQYRVSFPQGSKGYNITVQIVATQPDTIPIVLDSVVVYGQIIEELAPVTYLPNGST